MDCYIVSKLNCAVKINGKFIGFADGNLRFFSVENELLPCFCQVIPLDNNFLPCNILLERKNITNQDFLFNIDNGILIMPLFTPKPIFDEKILYSKSFESCNVFVVIDCFCKIIIQNESGTLTLPIDIPPSFCSAHQKGNGIFVETKGSKNLIYIFDISSFPFLYKKINYKNFQLNDDSTNIIEEKQGITKHFSYLTFSCSPLLIQDEIIERSVPISLLSPLLIGYAFLEELKNNKNWEDFLSEDLRKNSTMIKEFLGDFLTFIPLNKNNGNSALLINKDVKKLNFAIENNLIYDLSLE